jgi:pseudouridine synthase
VDSATDIVSVDGHVVSPQAKEYWLLNKPAGVLSAVGDERGRVTVVDLVSTSARLFPVGRLDMDTTGLLLLTNDGELTARLLHPRYHVEKEYLAEVRGALSEKAVEELRRGVLLQDGPASPASVRVRGSSDSGKSETTRLLITIHEGRKRQVRRMLEAVGHGVVSLHRTRFAGLDVSDLDIGQARRLTASEVSALWEQTNRH